MSPSEIQQEIYKVARVMTPAVHMVDGLATVTQALALMKEHKVSSLIINRRHDGDEFGIVVMEDIAVKVIGENRASERTNVYEIMSKPVITVDADMDIKYAIRLLARFGLSRALVTDQGKLCGIVTMRDMVMRYLSDETSP